MLLRVLLLLIVFSVALAPQPAQAQDAGAPAGGNATVQVEVEDTDADLNLSQPDFLVVTLPTTLRLPRFKSAFRVTHRFTRPLGQGDFGNLAEDFFGLDTGAVIGLEYRFGLARGWQTGIYRTSDRTIEFFTQYNVWSQPNKVIGLSVIASIDGTDNFTDSYTPTLGVVISRELGTWGALYLEPIWANNTNPFPSEVVDENDTFMVGIGARIRIRPTLYLVGEVIPGTGFRPGVSHGTFGFEKRLGGHVFQANFSNGIGSTMGQIARGGIGDDNWHLGFSISRKFF